MRFIYLLTVSILFFFTSCEEKKNQFKVELTGSSTGQSMKVERLHLNGEKIGVGSADLLPQGDTHSGYLDIVDWKPGIYSVSIGNRKFTLPMDNPNQSVTISGSMEDLNQNSLTVTGNPSAKAFMDVVDTIKTFKSREEAVAYAKSYVSTSPYIYPDMLLAAELLMNPANKEVLKSITAKGKEKFPESQDVKDFENLVKRVLTQLGPGSPAPDIAYSDPNGKVYKLSDLKGKVVLVDFWASWCRPCRYNNPHLVELYNKYHDKGFEIFSVSLDKDRNKWASAIDKDKLRWEYHVSDLQGWNCAPAKLYGVRGIPAAFLIDREGNLSTMNITPRQIEPMLKKML